MARRQTTTRATDGVRSSRISLGRIFRTESPNYYLLLGVTLFLVMVGLVMVISSAPASGADNATSQYFSGVSKQIVYTIIGVTAMLILARAPLRFWRKSAWILLGIALVGQLLVFTPLGVETQGNRNWILIGPINAQPSELIKVALAIWIGAVLSRKMHLLDRPMHVLIPVVFPGAFVALGLVLAGHDLGTVMVMSTVVMGGLFFAGVRLRLLAIPVVLGAAIFAGFAAFSSNRVGRILDFLDDEKLDYLLNGFQPLHGTWALASGGAFGVGLGNSRAKFWLPAASDDYIFAIIGEELGLVGATVVILLFALLGFALFRIIRASDEPMVRITTGAIMVWLMAQAFINIAVVLRLVPIIGVPLPFISAGGTALITSLMAIGVVLSFARTQESAVFPSSTGRKQFA